jgi:hypothetical protein
VRALLACLTLAATMGVTGTAPARADDAPACPAPGTQLLAQALPSSFSDAGCSWQGVVISSGGGAAAEVPPAGLAVTASATYPDGADDLSVGHLLDGTITVRDEEPAPDPVIPGEIAPTAPGECVDDVYARKDYKMPATGFRYSYTPTSEPAAVAASAATVVQAGATTISQAQDACGRATPAGIPGYTYVGTNTRAPNVIFDSAGIHCRGGMYGGVNDSVSIVGWLNWATPTTNLPLAFTCAWSTLPPVGTQSASNPGIVTEVDITLNAHYAWFTGAVPAGCSNTARKYDLHSVMAHEWGHGWGLGHPQPETPGAHDNLTMNYQTFYCNTSHRSLGYGDVKGLDARYP